MSSRSRERARSRARNHERAGFDALLWHCGHYEHLSMAACPW